MYAPFLDNCAVPVILLANVTWPAPTPRKVRFVPNTTLLLMINDPPFWTITALLPTNVIALPVSVFVPLPPLLNKIALSERAVSLVAVNCVSVLVPNCSRNSSAGLAPGGAALLVQLPATFQAPLLKPQTKSGVSR
ncbi:MAG: hypothetical protein PCFJNLEI_00969 [Verrucomicrobiae bacterium]|nr:hypothetical protein [Verrucomicrobiae bacterium]